MCAFYKEKAHFFRKIIEHFDSRFLEIWLLSQTPIIIAIIISKLLWRDYWYFFGESLRCNYRRALQIFRTLKPRKKIPSSMYNFFCSSNCIYQVQMTIMRGSITDKFWMFTFECNVLLNTNFHCTTYSECNHTSSLFNQLCTIN